MFKILLVDDEKPILKSLAFALEQDYEVYTSDNGRDALELVREHDISLVLLDLRLGKENGIQLMKEILAINPGAAIIIMTAYSSIESSVEAIKEGAFYFITKPVQTSQLLLLLEKAARQLDMRRTINSLEDVIRKEIIGDSPQMQQVLRLIDQVKDTKAGVLITGESGTGKELIANKLHFSSNRRNQPFVAVNCSALPETLLEAELFGYKKGAFTGAVRDEPGIIRKASRGTLFLDEVGEMDLRLQSKLLRFLQNGEVRQIGGDSMLVDVRVICATNRNLEQEIAAGRFRSDLYYRINVITINVPPLRERTEDLEHLVPFFIKKYATAYRKPITGISPEAFELLSRYDFPGNVRECENIIQRAVLLCSGNVITVNDLNLKYRAARTQENQQGRYIKVYANETMKDIERKVLDFALRLHGGNRRKTAESLGISERSLQYKIKEYGL
jgi:two-component system response regulator AtoC